MTLSGFRKRITWKSAFLPILEIYCAWLTYANLRLAEVVIFVSMSILSVPFEMYSKYKFSSYFYLPINQAYLYCRIIIPTHEFVYFFFVLFKPSFDSVFSDCYRSKINGLYIFFFLLIICGCSGRKLIPVTLVVLVIIHQKSRVEIVR